MTEMREAIARVITPWAFSKSDNMRPEDRASVGVHRDMALAKADAVIALLPSEGWRFDMENGLQFGVTGRGFVRADFVDLYDLECSLQKSSLADTDAIWLGGDERMHLSREMVARLLPALIHFASTGDLPPPPPSNQEKQTPNKAGE